MSEYLIGRVVIVSPHFDDAVLSLGSTIAAAVDRGASVEVITVFCGDPFSQTSAGPWDRKSGFASEGEAARARREEDRRACGILGASTRWLPFSDAQYERRGGEREIGTAIAKATAGAAAVLIPGSPLVNPDHAWLSPVLLKKGLNCAKLGLYLEQPYAYQDRVKASAVPTPALKAVLAPDFTPQWRRLPVTPATQALKGRAVRAYRSQLYQLGMRFMGIRRMLRYEKSAGGETVAWV
jgi:LmbE family N-acetylglucosaminyl deacetylase